LNIYGDDQFSNKEMRVAGNGTVALPFVGQVRLVGLTVNQAADEMARILAEGYLVDPKVSLEIIEYQSQWVNVSGQINSPGRYYLEGPTNLVEILAQAGGLGSEAGTTIRIIRPGRGGAADHTLTVSREDLYRSDDPAANPRVFSGDSVVASSEEYFYIKGEVRSPGRYALDEDTTILKAISIAGGFEQYAHHKKIELLRKEGDETIRLVLNVARIENRKAEDIRILPGDIINVQARFL
jgi:polysaccharide export outer membrane protein